MEIVWRHSEILGILYALNPCESGGFLYELPRATHKSARRRRYWQWRNEERVRQQRRG